MGYEFDIFLSYPRLAPNIVQWVFETFFPLFDGFLKSQSGKKKKIFIDQFDVSAGDSWPYRLKYALSRSRCMIAIWSPPFFTSEWCCREYAVMRHRAQSIGFTCPDNPIGIVLPIKVWGGDSFPPSTNNTTPKDFSKYCYSGKAFTDSARHLDFQIELRDWIPKVVTLIESVPAWQEVWGSPEYLDVPFDDLLNPDDPHIPLKRMK